MLPIQPKFGKIQPTQQTQIQNITFDEAGLTFDQAGYTFDGLSGTYGNLPKGGYYEPEINI